MLEDDVKFPAEARPALDQIIAFLQGNKELEWDCLNLTETYAKRRRLLHERPSWSLFRAYYFPMLASGLLWSREGAVRFLEHVERTGIFLPVDQQIRFHLAHRGRGLSLDRPLLQLHALATTIEARDTAPSPKWNSKFSRKIHNYFHAFLKQSLRK